MIRMVINDCKFEQSLDEINSMIISLENKKYFYSFISDLQVSYSEINSIKLFDEREKELKNSDYFEVIPSIFGMDVNNKKNINALLKIIKSDNKEFIQNYVNKTNENLEMIAKTLNLESEIPFETDIDFIDDDLLKMLNIHIKQETNSLVELIFSYIKTTFELRKIKIFIFANLIDYLEDEEISLLLKNCVFLDVIIIDIESKNIKNSNFQFNFILDKSLCLI